MTDASQDLTQRVHDALARLHPRSALSDLRTLDGGHSGLTYVVSAGNSRYVVKAVPPGQRAVGRNDVLRQSGLLSRLVGQPVAVPVIVAEDATEPAWFAMSFAPGEAVEPVLDEHDLPPDLLAARMRRAAVELANLHRVPVADVVPDDVDPLTAEAELERWGRTMAAVPEALAPGGLAVVEQLRERIPAPVEPTLVHGDFRLGNFLFVGDQPSALVDWEIWGVGDPRVDLGWFLTFVDANNFPGVGHAVPGLPTEEALVSLYAPGRIVPELAWFRALGRLKMAAIMGHNLKRHREGKHVDPVQESLPPTIARLIDTARTVAAQA